MLELTQRIKDVESSEIYDSLTLPYELRIRGRLRATTDNNHDVGLFLDRGPVLREGECLQAQSGEIIRIRAADEPVVTATIKSGFEMARLCYHLGNRHVALQIGSSGAIGMTESGPDAGKGWIRFPPDHVLEELAERLGATLKHHQAPFDPEPGAYDKAGQSHGHGHSDSHSDGHSASHSHSESDSHSQRHSHSHSHSESHSHSHGLKPVKTPGSGKPHAH